MADKADLFSDTLSSYADDAVPVSRKSQYAKQFFPFNLKVVDKNFGEMTKSVYKIEE